MVRLLQFQDMDVIYDGDRTLVYRALRKSDRQPVIIKVLRNSHPTFNELIAFRNQYVITQQLDSPLVVKPLGLERCSNGYALVMPDVGAVSLASYWRDSDRDLGELLQIAIQLAEALHLLAGQQIIHKDIKPANILIHPETKQVQLIDFSIASLLPKEQQQLVTPTGLEGTLAYISPEQTGRMNRGLDYRTDFYALGVTLYELLTGTLPFEVGDPLELIHCHIAQSPIAPAERRDDRDQAYPAMLSAIVMKLMAKNSEDRYQSALGLKYDLERCWQSWDATGEIAEFEVGERDICDRFNIPEKLYGRETEVQSLLDAFDRVSSGSSEMMLVAGFSGIGKTAVVNEIHKPIVRQRGYFIKGKFDQFNRNIPFSAFVQAFRNLMEQMLGESDAELRAWKTQILNAIGENGQILVDVIPELELIIGAQPAVSELSGTAAQDRFNLLFEKFIAVFATPEHPLVLFVDDLQWIDSASLNLIRVLTSRNHTGYLLLIGAYRDNEVSATHPLTMALADLRKQDVCVSQIELAPLSLEHVNQMVAETLGCTRELALPLAKLVNKKAKGNPFFTAQFLYGLYQDGSIAFERELGCWQCDLAKVQDSTLTDDVVDFMADRLQRLPNEAQETLSLAACIGNNFDLETLTRASGRPEADIAAALWQALQSGAILPTDGAYKFYQPETDLEGLPSSAKHSPRYRFLHDRVQQAARISLSERDRANNYLRIAEVLEEKYASESTDNIIFDIANHYNQADCKALSPERRRNALARNLQAGRCAQAATAFEAANVYFECALDLISTLYKRPWQMAYTTVFELYVDWIRTKNACLLWEESQEANRTLYENSRDRQDKAVSLQLAIEHSTQRGEFSTAIDYGREALNLLDQHIPETDLDVVLQNTIAEIRQQSKAIARIRDGQFKILTDRRFKQILSILSSLDAAAYLTATEFWKVINALSVKITLLNGITSEGVAGLARFGQILCGRLDGSYAEGTTFAQVALQLSDIYPEQKGLVCFEMGLSINHWLHPLQENTGYFQSGFQASMDRGLTLYADYNLMFQPYYRHYAGASITGNIDTIDRYVQIIEKSKNALADVLLAGFLPHLQYLAANKTLASWRQWSDSFIQQAAQQQNSLAIAIHSVTAGQIYYLIEDWEMAEVALSMASEHCSALLGYFSLVEHEFYCALLWLQRDRLSGSGSRQSSDRLDRSIEQLRLWGNQNPHNCAHKYTLVCAERSRAGENRSEAIDLYDRAIAEAKEHGFIQEEALANELAAKFYLDWGKHKIAASYMQDAYLGYAHWGAEAVTARLEANYPELLAPILQQSQIEYDATDSISLLTQTLTSAVETHTASGTKISEALDFVSVFQAAQKLTSIVEFDSLLGDITEIVITNAGAQKMALLVPSGEQWQIRAIAKQIDQGDIITDTRPQTLTTESPVPIRLIQYVNNTQKPVLINEAAIEIPGILEGYLLEYQPQSALCLPLMAQGDLVAIAYLEHPSTKGVFTSRRQTVVEFLCAQAAVALQNAQLYDQAQTALTDLQQAQLQLVQSEKMSALGNLVSGVAHEINNPLGFLQGNIQPAQDYVQDLLGLIALYQDKYPEPDEEIEDEIEAIDLDFVREDLPNLIESMNTGIDRIRSISTSLRTFSRTDREQKTAFDIHDGLDSTLLILKHRTKANEDRPAVEIIKHYGELPEVQCFPGQLNQVFMNILANALDAFDDTNRGKSYQDIEREPNRIQIHTTSFSDGVQVQIQDNGCGMKPETAARIFEQGFTTKAVGDGTGLGMAIAHQIVTETHGGAIACTSTPNQGTTFTVTLPL